METKPVPFRQFLVKLFKEVIPRSSVAVMASINDQFILNLESPMTAQPNDQSPMAPERQLPPHFYPTYY